MRIIRRALIAAAAGLAAGIMLAVPAAGAGVHHTAGHRCTAPWDASIQTNPTPQYGEADWEGQNCNYALQVETRCNNRLGQGSNFFSPIRTSNEVEGRASCSSNYPAMVRVSINFRKGGTWVGWCELWPVRGNC